MTTIRDALPTDIDTIVDYNARLAAETENKTLDRTTLEQGVASAVSDPARGARYWVAEVDGEPVGQIMVTLEWSDWRNGFFWWIQSVYVTADYRKKSILKQLYSHVEELARSDRDVCGLRLYVEHANHRAQEVYERLGMRRAGYEVFEREW